MTPSGIEPACSAVPQPTTLPRAPFFNCTRIIMHH